MPVADATDTPGLPVVVDRVTWQAERDALLEVFEVRRQLIAYFHMWHTGHPAAAQWSRLDAGRSDDLGTAPR
ncbi:MAG: hypothetical protein ACRDSP_10960 [Pseudonocardiaceae bacterium]